MPATYTNEAEEPGHPIGEFFIPLSVHDFEHHIPKNQNFGLATLLESVLIIVCAVLFHKDPPRQVAVTPFFSKGVRLGFDNELQFFRHAGDSKVCFGRAPHFHCNKPRIKSLDQEDPLLPSFSSGVRGLGERVL